MKFPRFSLFLYSNQAYLLDNVSEIDRYRASFFEVQ